MKSNAIKTLVSVALLSSITTSVWAAGTAAGTDIDNTAFITYKVGTVDQTPIYSAPGAGNNIPGVPGSTGAPTVASTLTSFVVDKKIDLTVTEGSDASVAPGSFQQAVTYILKNTGNSPEYFKLNSTQVGSDAFDTTNCAITAAAPATAGTGADTIQLAADAESTITVKCDIPASSATVVNGAVSNLDLKATAVTDTTGATVYADSPTDTAGVDVVLADAKASTGDSDATDTTARNASHSAVNSYIIGSANLTVQKTEAVSGMPAGAGPNNFHIPGATITYTITVSNAAGASTAKDIVISDLVKPELETVAATITGGTSSNPVTVGAPTGTGIQVTSGTFDLAAGETATLTITAKVK